MRLLAFLILCKTTSALDETSSVPSSEQDVPSCSLEEFCTKKCSFCIKPRNIPRFLDDLHHCSALAKVSSRNAYARRHALLDLFDALLPALHKAFFDSQTGMKYIIDFTKLKHDAVEYTKYADAYENHLMQPQKQKKKDQVVVTYDQSEDVGSYDLEEELNLCKVLLNLEPNVEVENIVKSSQLPKIARVAKLIVFPPFNLSVGLTSEDAPYMILDLYVLVTRCLSYTDLPQETITQVGNCLIDSLKKKVMICLPPNEFEKAHSRMISLVEGYPKLRTQQVCFHPNPSNFDGDMMYENDYFGDHITNSENEAIVEKYVKSRPNEVDLSRSPILEALQNLTLAGALGYQDSLRADYDVESQQRHENKHDPSNYRYFLDIGGKPKYTNYIDEALPLSDMDELYQPSRESSGLSMKVVSALAIATFLALTSILYCIVFGRCGWVSVSWSSIDCSENANERASCGTLSESRRNEIVTALHLRCENLAKKIHQLVGKMSNEMMSDEARSIGVMREFTRAAGEELMAKFNEYNKKHTDSNV